jgi:hypothetical protein
LVKLLVKENMIVVSERVSENRWNNALQSAGVHGTLFQSTYWAEYLRQVQGDQPIYLFSEDKRGNINGLLLAVQSCYGRFPVFNWGRFESARGHVIRNMYKTVLEKVFEKMLPFVYWQNGPVILKESLKNNHNECDKIYRSLIEKVLNISDERKFYAINARPSYFMDYPELMNSYGFEKRRMGTILVDLGNPIESIWRSLERRTRRNITKIKDSIVYDEARSLKDLQMFYILLVQLTKRLKIKPWPFHHYESLWNFFHPLGKIVAFIAFLNEKPIGANVLLMHNSMVHEYMYADSDFARSNKIYVIDALKWHTIVWAHDKGFKYLDLGGAFQYMIEAGDEKFQNILRFKSKFGEVIDFNDYHKLTDKTILRLRLKSAKILNLFLPESSGCFTY